jgi:putative ABC transport system permease protein
MRINQLFRSLFRDRLNTSVVIISLAVGIASFNLIIMFINRELGTDSFQDKDDQIFALKCDDPWFPGKKIYYCKFGSAEYMKANFPQVEDFCRITNSGSQKIVINNETYFDHPAIISASANFFSFFSYSLLSNNQATVLESKSNIAISEELAKKYFGHENPLGRVIEIVNRDKTDKMIISGIFKKPVENTQLVFDMVRQIGESDSRCYIRLTKQSKKDEMEKLFFERKGSIPVINVGTPVPYYLESLREAYFDTIRRSAVETSRNITDLWVALVIGMMIFGIASFNYLGILSNRFLMKIKEFKIRQINGGSRSGIISSFMFENSILIGFSYLVSLYLMFELIPFFNELTGSNITVKFIFQPAQIVILMAVIAFIWIITLLFVFYLIYTEANNNFFKVEQTRQIKSVQMPVLNIFQIASSIALIICSIIIIRQMKFITRKPIGLDKTVIEVKLPGQYSDKALVFKEELIKNKSIKCISIVGSSPVLEHFLVSLKYQQDGVEKQYSLAGFSGDENYLKVLGIELIDGNDFSETESVIGKKCLINQSLAKLFPEQDLVGKSIPGMEDVTIIGIVKDFNYFSLKSYVEPSFISYSKKGSHLLVKASANQTIQARKIIAQVWHKLIPDYPIDTESVGDRFEWFHRENKNYIKLITSCSIISLFLSMIGLFTISFQKTRSRTKEIGIRRINGARVIDILIILNKDIVRWIFLALLLAVPASWYAMNKWLHNYAYKTEISWWVFVLAGTITLSIALLTVSWQSLRAATRNPVEALRYE